MERIKTGEIFNLRNTDANIVIVKAEKSKAIDDTLYWAIWDDGFEEMVYKTDLLHDSRYIRTGRCISLDYWYAFLDSIKGTGNEEQ